MEFSSRRQFVASTNNDTYDKSHSDSQLFRPLFRVLKSKCQEIWWECWIVDKDDDFCEAMDLPGRSGLTCSQVIVVLRQHHSKPTKFSEGGPLFIVGYAH